MKSINIYKGEGKLQPFTRPETKESPENYIASPALARAVNVAITLGQPLLVTGEPGTGKSQLAYSVAHDLDLGEPEVFYVKTTTQAMELFYTYDALAHFQDSQSKENKKINKDDYITYQALGKAIQSNERKVILIDEIDKAPRDVPNDILNEIESLKFTVKETNTSFEAKSETRPIIIFTSNSEKNLPDAFLRRCVFYNLQFPSAEELFKIVKKRLPEIKFVDDDIKALIKSFEEIRETVNRKRPATAELLSWIYVLDKLSVKVNQTDSLKELVVSDRESWLVSYSVLIKTVEDLELLYNMS